VPGFSGGSASPSDSGAHSDSTSATPATINKDAGRIARQAQDHGVDDAGGDHAAERREHHGARLQRLELRLRDVEHGDRRGPQQQVGDDGRDRGQRGGGGHPHQPMLRSTSLAARATVVAPARRAAGTHRGRCRRAQRRPYRRSAALA
jgi:hypothetical protein